MEGRIWPAPMVMAAVFIVALLNGCETLGDWVEGEKDMALSEAPTAVLEAARDALPGIVFTSAEIETEQGQTVFDLEGEVDGRKYDVEITADGRIIEIERKRRIEGFPY